MNKDHRNQPVILAGDGVPFFKKEGQSRRGGWPLVLRSATLPDGLWNDPCLTHISTFIANEYVDGLDKDGRRKLIFRYRL